MVNDILIILKWWGAVSMVGVLFLPLTFYLFPKFWDKGYAFSKIIGILITSYLVWLLGSLKVLPFSTAGVWLVLAVVAGGNLYFFFRSWRRQVSRSPKEEGQALKASGLGSKTPPEPSPKSLAPPKGRAGLGNSGSFLRRVPWKIILFEEALFLICLVGWSLVRGFQPDIRGLEKFMDYGFVTSILRSRHFPPADMWLAGETINYYYFGHLVAAVLTKLSGIGSAITYNLMIATIFALSFGATFSLGANLIHLSFSFCHPEKRSDEGSHYANRDSSPRPRTIRCGAGAQNDRLMTKRLGFIGGLLSAALVTLGGNLHPLWYFIKEKTLATYWYPDATRFIVEKFGAADNTIHEFPLYSSVVADLHGHYSDLPFVLLFLALLCRQFLENTKHPHTPTFLRSCILTLLHSYIPTSLVLGVMLMTNPWDFPIYGLLLALVLFWKNLKQLRHSDPETSGEESHVIKNSLRWDSSVSRPVGIPQNDGKLCWLIKVLWRTFWGGIPFALLAVLFSLPFHLNFEQIAQGVALVHARSPFWQLLVLWGFFWFCGLVFLVFKSKKRIRRVLKPESLVKGLARLFNLRVKVSGSRHSGVPHPPTGGCWGDRISIPNVDSLIIIFISLATLLIIIPEIIYVKDIYIASHHRANTMFKLTYQAFVLYALSGGYIITRVLLMGGKRRRLLLFGPLALFLASVFAYPYMATRSFYGLKTYRGLDGLTWLARDYSDDYLAILWLRGKGQALKAPELGSKTSSEPSSKSLALGVGRQPVILEAVGESYTDYARVSAYTGLPTVLGWPVHEWLWRGGYDEPGKRREEVRKIYELTSLGETKQLLDQYQVRYIFVGDLERKQYSNLNEKKFDDLAEPVFRSGETVIYGL